MLRQKSWIKLQLPLLMDGTASTLSKRLYRLSLFFPFISCLYVRLSVGWRTTLSSLDDLTGEDRSETSGSGLLSPLVNLQYAANLLVKIMLPVWESNLTPRHCQIFLGMVLILQRAPLLPETRQHVFFVLGHPVLLFLLLPAGPSSGQTGLSYSSSGHHHLRFGYEPSDWIVHICQLMWRRACSRHPTQNP